jgi:hypothetical protein
VYLPLPVFLLQYMPFHSSAFGFSLCLLPSTFGFAFYLCYALNAFCL